MKTRGWLLVAGAALALLIPRKVEAGACISARFHDWQDGGCNQNFAGVGGANSGQSGAGGNNAHCTGCPGVSNPGMPRWWVSEPYEDLWLSDTPLSYRMSSGQEMELTFYYRQRYQLPAPDEVPNFYTPANYPSAHETMDYYARLARTCGLTNAAWGHNWMKDIIFWDHQWETSSIGNPFGQAYEAFVFSPQGDIQYFYNISGQPVQQDPRNQVQLQPLSALGYPTVSQSPVADANGIYWGDSQTNGLQLVYADGSKDVFGLCYYPAGLIKAGNSSYSGAHAFLTQQIDPQGRVTQLGYEYFLNTNCLGAQITFGYRLRYVVDPDGRTNTFRYVNSGFYNYPPPNPFALQEVDDPYGRKVQLGYDFYSGILTSIQDAAGLTSSFQYQTPIVTNTYSLGNCSSGATGQTNIVGLGNSSGGWITNLATPYGSTSFTYYQLPDPDPTVTNGFQQRAVYVSEPQGAQQLFVYEHTNWLIAATGTSPTNIPGQSFDDGTSGSTPHYILNYRNTFHWGRRQFAALSSGAQSLFASGSLSNAIATLTNVDYNKADLKHWLLLGTDLVSITEALSSEQDPSPDAAGQIPGSRTWYNYPDKPSAELLGDDPQVSCIARLLPDSSSQYITYNFYPSAYPGTGLASDNESSYSRPDGTVGLLTNWFHYASNGIDLTSMSNSVGQYWNFAYNGNHQVTSFTNALGQVSQAGYGPGTPNLTSLSLPSGQTMALSYYTSANPPSATSSMLETITLQPQNLTVQINGYAYGLPSVVQSSGTNLPSLTVTNFWDGLNRLTGTVFPDGTSVSNIYDRLYLGAAKDRLGHWTGYGYDGLEHITTITNALTNVTTLGWCDCGSLSSITDPLTNITSLNYNNQGLLINITNADNSSVTYGLDSIGRVISAADGLGKALTFGYNNQGLLTTISNAYGLLSGVVYDAANRPVQVTDANGVTVTNQFDPLDRLTARLWPDGIDEGFGWSTNGPIAYTNRDQNVTRFTRDGAGRLTCATNANMEVTQLGYNALNELTDLWDGRTNHTVWNYNQYGCLMSKTNTLGQAVIVYTRDPNGQVTNRWTPQFGNTSYGRDALGNILAIIYPQSTNRYTYDALNRLKTMVDDSGTTTFGYTAAGQLQSAGGLWSSDTVTYGYLQQLRQTLTLAQPSGGNWQQNYTFDNAWRLQTLSSPAGSFGYGFSAVNAGSPLFRTLTLPNYASITNHYDSLARLDYTALVNYWGHVLDGYGYGMDALGLRTNITRNLGLTNSSVAVGYDAIGQVISWQAREDLSGPLRLNEQYNYVYDKAGNLWLRTNGSLAQTFNCDGLNQLTNVTRNNAITLSGATPAPATNITINGQVAQRYGDMTFAATNLSLVSGTNTFTIIAQNVYGLRVTNTVNSYLPSTNNCLWDSNGNLTNDGTRSFAYDAENRLVTNWVAGTWKTEFVYDGLGRRRIERDYGWQSSQWVKTNETRYIYDGYLLIQERDSNNVMRVTYTRGVDLSSSLTGAGGIGGLLARTDTNSSTFYHADGAGNITALMDGQQNIAARYMYSAFGRLTGQWGPMGPVNRMQVSSMPTDLSGGVHFPYRDYDTILQRFRTRDPIGEAGGINLYGFVYNNPLAWIDPLGLDNMNPTPAQINANSINNGPVNIVLTLTPIMQPTPPVLSAQGSPTIRQPEEVPTGRYLMSSQYGGDDPLIQYALWAGGNAAALLAADFVGEALPGWLSWMFKSKCPPKAVIAPGTGLPSESLGGTIYYGGYDPGANKLFLGDMGHSGGMMQAGGAAVEGVTPGISVLDTPTAVRWANDSMSLAQPTITTEQAAQVQAALQQAFPGKTVTQVPGLR